MPLVPTLCVGMLLVTLCVTLCVTLWDAERPRLHSHAERGNDQANKRAAGSGNWRLTLPAWQG
ncbi:hypothetical protein C1891_26250 [Pseudomonas sp. GW456-12-1-14-TSB6]|nr:hypothetical protein C1891_26250 [Pseudomonas sp. GW456-12-1-14-TSB6]